MTFNAKVEALRLKNEKKLITKKRFKPSKLDKHKQRLLALYEEDTSIANLQRWLLRKGMRVHWTTVKRWVQKNA